MKFTVSLIVSLTCLSTFAADGFAFERHQKTNPTLPQGAPLPDVEIPPNDDISPKIAFNIARRLLSQCDIVDATEYFERAIAALRRTNGQYDKRLAKRIVLDYGVFLRAHLAGDQKACELEREFGVSPKEAERNEQRALQNFSINRFVQHPSKPEKRRSQRLQVIQSHDFSKDTKVYLLCKPNGRNIVAVLYVQFNAPTLNPETAYFDYGPIPPLWQMSISIADALWGAKSYEAKSSEQNEVERTYELRSTQMNGKTITKKRFFLDAVFFDKQLRKYRVRAESLSPIWQTVPGQ